MKNAKTILALLLSAVMLTSLVACGSDEDTSDPSDTAEVKKTTAVKKDDEKVEKTDYVLSDEVKNAKVGDCIVFGIYEQDNVKKDPHKTTKEEKEESKNKTEEELAEEEAKEKEIENSFKEPLEWVVLDRTDDSILVVTKYLVDAQPYHTENRPAVTWESSTLRTWLNEEFLAEAFVSGETPYIVKTEIKTEANEQTGFEGGKDTKDKVFILSADEWAKYVPEMTNRQASTTKYCVKARAVYVTDQFPNESKLYEKDDSIAYVNDSTGYIMEGTSWYWTRTVGDRSDRVAAITFDGNINYEGTLLTGAGGVRPAMWIKVK